MTMPASKSEMLPTRCQICGYATDAPPASDLGAVRGNTERFKDRSFQLWRCPECATIHGLDAVDLHDIYRDYALEKRRLDVFARGTLGNLTRRLTRAGMRKDHAILDYGCGNGLYVEYLRSRGFADVVGYDPFVPGFENLSADRGPYDVVVNNDAIEHCDDVRGVIQHNVDLLKPGGLLYIGTADSSPVAMGDLEPQIMRLHQPFHRVIFTERSLHRLATDFGLQVGQSYRRSYQDTLRPFSNYRFLDELNRALDHNLDRALTPEESTRAFIRSPRLWFFAFFGFLFPSAYEPAVIARKPG
jgi:SAM-dependent methyltransferase